MERVGDERRPGGPVAHLTGHLADEVVALLDQLIRTSEGEGVGTDGGGEEIGRFARHDEAGEPFVGREEDEGDPEIQVALLGAIEEVAIERRLHEGCRQRLEALAEVLLGMSRARIRLTDAPEILTDGFDVASSDPLPDPGREVHAGDAARGVVRPRKTGEVGMAESARKAGQFGGDSIGECHGRRAEIESLHRHEATQVSVRVRSRAAVEGDAADARRPRRPVPGDRIC